MSFRCSDTEEALRASEMPPEATTHAQTCEHCRERIALWTEISDIAPQLRQEWESPSLWPQIQHKLEATAKRGRPVRTWRWALAAAATIVLGAVLLRTPPTQQTQEPPQDGTFLNPETLREVQEAEQAYVRAIEKLSATAESTLHEASTPLAAAYREKLLLLDSAIADLKTGAEANRYDVYVRTQLASLYQAKQRTLEEWLKNAQNN
jgi:hypothetical protein